MPRSLQKAGLPEELRDYVLGKGSATKFDQALRRYEFVRACRQSLREIIRGASPKTNASLWLSMSPAPEIRIDGRGVIRVDSDEFSRAIDGVEANRIRECKICKHIFWARRITQNGCTTTCANTLRVRRWRERYATTYKYTRMGLAPPGKKKTS